MIETHKTHRLAHALEHATHLLPAQAPIRIFVHHNTLHAFEDLPFEQALVQASSLFGTEPYLTELAFREHLASGRIRPEDCEAVLAQEGLPEKPIFPGGPTPLELRRRRLLEPFEVPRGVALDWWLIESDVLATARARDLWARLAAHAPVRSFATPALRPRDAVLMATGVDIDRLVQPLLIRLCGAFVDQGVAYWPMPERERGLLTAFRSLYGRPFGPPDPWLKGLSGELAHQMNEGWDAERTVLEMLDALQMHPETWDESLAATLLSLKGWAGMIRQLEERPEQAPVKAPPAKLIDYLAVQLILERQALRHVMREHFGHETLMPEWSRLLPTPAPRADRSVAYEALVMAERMGLGPESFVDPDAAASWVREVGAFDELSRRRVLHLAFERHHRHGLLDALLNHDRLGNAPKPQARVQAVFCIDEREESLRRHLEEVFPEIETFGFAGFFGVAMAYQGLEDAHPTPLCPVFLRPRHVVVEEAIAPGNESTRRRLLGRARLSMAVGSRTLVRGGLVSALAGIAYMAPLVGRTLFPRLAERLSHALHHHSVGRPRTRLKLERSDVLPETEGPHVGYTVPEMAGIVEDMLRAIALDRDFSRLVLVVGHGSTSLNNPHESAHDCGATGGNRGGPNARAFAMMANHPGVRSLLRDRGLVIPDEAWFLGAYHNSCDETMQYYDDDLMPEGAKPEYEAVQRALEEACRRNAQERCRRFESAALSIGLEEAMEHVETHSVDLGQPRPEYGHATNAVCFVGRRSRTRGLYMDRRAFLASYDPERDTKGEILGPLLASVAAVGAGINLEYYFSFVDPTGYGCGTKLPHNIVGLVGVMDGHASDLRTGLPWQMVEIHEPVRLLTVVEAEPSVLERVLRDHPDIGRLVRNRWVQLAAWSPRTGEMSLFQGDRFVPYQPETRELPVVPRSADHFRGHREHLPCARVEAGLRTGARP